MCKNNIFDNINGYPLDDQQIKAATSNYKHSIIIAGAGSGKSTTMIGKVKYLIKILNVNPEQILCISFTNEATNSLKNNIRSNCNVDIEVKTFHKLALSILEANKIEYQLIETNYLEFIINEYFQITHNPNIRKNIIYFIKNKYYLNNDFEYNNLLKSNEIKSLKKLILKFLNLYMSKYESFNELINLITQTTNYKEQAFLKIVFSIYYLYELEKYSQNLIDFDDMIKKATNIVNNEGIIKNYKYIIIDEFQDTSINRFNLIKAIIKRTNAILTVVGDDFQSIYRFSGCTLDLFLNFQKEFKNVDVLKIENTYRNSQELINIAGSFIMQNPKQIQKDLKSSKRLKKPIKIIYEKPNTLKKLLIYLNTTNYKSILLLGRNNFDINKYIDKDLQIDKDGYIKLLPHQNISIRFLSVHKSKGLEADICIILNLAASELGFPNQIEDHKILKYVNTYDEYPFEEERRLFYVALTRTKNYVYLLTEKNNSSIFVKELLKNYKDKIDIKNII